MAAKKIILYSTTDCHWCQKTREFFKKRKVAFKEIDVSSDTKAANEMIKKSGQTGVPVIEVDGKIIVGFDEQALKKVIGK